ncbi:ATP-grasp domain-containing protein [Chitinimonas lacunae]|uniref:ATP-grasp domain-containing protein n=1 Tax=Chitinimonas lacunae TaxID=1963018 RepID=A0ABV8MU07_9NEIS
MKVLAIEVSQFGNYYNSRYEHLEKHGVELFVLSGSADKNHWHKDRFAIAKSKQFDDLIETARLLHQQHRFDGVFTFAESSVIATSLIAQALGLPSIGPDAAICSRNKFFMRQGHQRFGAPHPAFELVPTLEAAVAAGRKIGYPAILKPTLGAGSQFVYKLNNEDELIQMYPKAWDGVQTFTHVSNEGSSDKLGPNSLLLESFLDGREFLIEAFTWDGETVLGSIVDRVTLEGNNFDDDVHHAPTDMTPEQIAKVHKAVHQGALAQGLKRSVMHAEIRFHQGEPFILEIAARPGGGGLDHMARISAGYCPLMATVNIAAGKRPANSAYTPTGKDTFALCLISAAGEIANITIPAEVSEDPMVFMLKMVVTPGSRIRRPPYGNDIAGFLGVSGLSREETEAKAKAYASAITFQMR